MNFSSSTSFSEYSTSDLHSNMAPQAPYKLVPYNPGGILPSRMYPTLAHGAAALALLPAVFGIGVYMDPQVALNSLKIPTPTNDEDKKKIYAVFRLSAAREMAFGVATFGIWHFAARRGYWTGYCALGLAMLAKGAMKLSDGIVIRDLVGEGEWSHWGFVLPDVFAGLVLLGWI
jgi:hypothetical protein